MSTKINGNITKISDTEFTFTPTDNLDVNTKYKMVVSKEFKSDDGISLNSDFKSVFTTADGVSDYWDGDLYIYDDEGIKVFRDDVLYKSLPTPDTLSSFEDMYTDATGYNHAYFTRGLR